MKAGRPFQGCLSCRKWSWSKAVTQTSGTRPCLFWVSRRSINNLWTQTRSSKRCPCFHSMTSWTCHLPSRWNRPKIKCMISVNWNLISNNMLRGRKPWDKMFKSSWIKLIKSAHCSLHLIKEKVDRSQVWYRMENNFKI